MRKEDLSWKCYSNL